MDKSQKYKFLYSRAGFGLSIDDYSHPKEIAEAVKDLFPKALPLDLEMIEEQEWLQNNPKAMKAIMDDEERKDKKKQFRQRTNELNLLWVQAMINSNFPLLEKMAMFWHGHFATHIDNPYFDQKLLNIFRKNGLGNFGELLQQVSKSAAMLQYLNNKQNKKMHPNENFAREVMELFTLGRGHYTEDDIKEAARAFTGWNYDEEGNFEFKEKQHDFSSKTFLGKTGNFTGDDILKIILEQKQTAIFITQKIYRYFVSDEKIDETRVKHLATAFYNSNYNIPTLLTAIFTADWFYTTDVVGAKVKSPIELLVGYQKTIPMQFNNPKTIIHIQKTLGQYLFNPPNVAGWAGGKNWIDSSSLVIRMRLPEAIYGTAELNLHIKESGNDVNTEKNENTKQDSTDKDKPYKIGKVQADWSAFLSYWNKISKDDLPKQLSNYLLTTPIDDQQLKEIVSFTDQKSNDDFIKSLSIRLMELPEYQLT